jgi:hypothetical protein
VPKIRVACSSILRALPPPQCSTLICCCPFATQAGWRLWGRARALRTLRTASLERQKLGKNPTSQWEDLMEGHLQPFRWQSGYADGADVSSESPSSTMESAKENFLQKKFVNLHVGGLLGRHHRFDLQRIRSEPLRLAQPLLCNLPIGGGTSCKILHAENRSALHKACTGTT